MIEPHVHIIAYAVLLSVAIFAIPLLWVSLSDRRTTMKNIQKLGPEKYIVQNMKRIIHTANWAERKESCRIKRQQWAALRDIMQTTLDRK